MGCFFGRNRNQGRNSYLQRASTCTAFKQIWNPKSWKFFRLVAQTFTDLQPCTEQPCANSAEGQSGAVVIRSLRVQPQGTVLLGRLHVCGGIRGAPRNAGRFRSGIAKKGIEWDIKGMAYWSCPPLSYKGLSRFI